MNIFKTLSRKLKSLFNPLPKTFVNKVMQSLTNILKDHDVKLEGEIILIKHLEERTTIRYDLRENILYRNLDKIKNFTLEMNEDQDEAITLLNHFIKKQLRLKSDDVGFQDLIYTVMGKELFESNDIDITCGSEHTFNMPKFGIKLVYDPRTGVLSKNNVFEKLIPFADEQRLPAMELLEHVLTVYTEALNIKIKYQENLNFISNLANQVKEHLAEDKNLHVVIDYDLLEVHVVHEHHQLSYYAARKDSYGEYIYQIYNESHKGAVDAKEFSDFVLKGVLEKNKKRLKNVLSELNNDAISKILVISKAYGLYLINVKDYAEQVGYLGTVGHLSKDVIYTIIPKEVRINELSIIFRLDLDSDVIGLCGLRSRFLLSLRDSQLEIVDGKYVKDLSEYTAYPTNKDEYALELIKRFYYHHQMISSSVNLAESIREYYPDIEEDTYKKFEWLVKTLEYLYGVKHSHLYKETYWDKTDSISTKRDLLQNILFSESFTGEETTDPIGDIRKAALAKLSELSPKLDDKMVNEVSQFFSRIGEKLCDKDQIAVDFIISPSTLQ